tara:strand:- start:759 stop:932 length:174 start_codon:yes stop_codon:yes gene_type:complete
MIKILQVAFTFCMTITGGFTKLEKRFVKKIFDQLARWMFSTVCESIKCIYKNEETLV